MAIGTFPKGGKGGKQWGDDSDNVLVGTLGKDQIHGGGGNDTITGDLGDDKLWGDDGDDTVDGGVGKDKIEGGAGADTLTGGDGDDELTGGANADTMTGGAGRDRFVLGSLDDANGDHVADYDRAGKDRLDIKWAYASGEDDSVDASKGGFSFIGGDAFTDAGQVRVKGSEGAWTVYVNVDADLGADYAFTVSTVGGVDLTAKDFNL